MRPRQGAANGDGMTNIGSILRSPARWAIVLLALGLFLRLFQLGEWSFWHDEADTVLLARKPIAEIVQITSADVHPPLYFLVVKASMVLGPGEFPIRLPSALASSACILFIYLVGRDLFDERTALLAAVVMALSPLQLFYAQEARMYAQLVLLTLFCSWCLMRALRDQGWVWWGLLGLGATLASYTSYFAFPFLLAMLVYVLWTRDRAYIVRFLLTMGIAALFYAPWIGVLFTQSRAIMASHWMERPHVLTLFTTLCAFFVSYSLSPFWVAVSLVAVLFVVFLALNQVRRAFRRQRPGTRWLVWLLVWAFVPLVGTYAVSLALPIFQIRTVIAAAPAFYLLVAWGLAQIERRAVRWAVFAPTALVMLLSAGNFYFDPAFSKPAWRQAAFYVNERVRPGDIVIHTSTGSYLTFLCYEHDVEHVRLPEDPGTARANAASQPIISAIGGPPQEIADAVRGYDRAWLVVGLDHAVEYQLEQKRRFDEQYALLSENEVGGIYVSTYALP